MSRATSGRLGTETSGRAVPERVFSTSSPGIYCTAWLRKGRAPARTASFNNSWVYEIAGSPGIVNDGVGRPDEPRPAAGTAGGGRVSNALHRRQAIETGAARATPQGSRPALRALPALAASPTGRHFPASLSETHAQGRTVSTTELPQAPPDHRPALLAGFLGWTLDAFDFFLVVLCLTAIGKDFGKSDVDVAFSLTLTLAFRPVGAFVFGLIADRFGRRLPLMLDLVFFSIVEVLTGLAPNFTVFLILRALYGIGMGAEWGVGATLAMEKAPDKRRGILSGILQEGYAFGYLLAAGCYWLIFPHFGWRPMFFVGGLPALLAVYVRYQVEESEVWEKVRHTTWRSLFGEIASNWKLVLYITLLMGMMNAVSHGTQDLYPTFLQRGWHLTPQMRAALTAFSMVGAIVGGVVTGLVSDRIGRRKAIVGTLLLAVLAIPIWAFAPGLAVLWIGAFVMQFMVQGAWGVIPAHITELSPDGVRGFLPGFAYQCGALIAGLVMPLEARIAEPMGYGRAMALVALVVFVLAALVAWLGHERKAVRFGGSVPS